MGRARVAGVASDEPAAREMQYRASLVVALIAALSVVTSPAAFARAPHTLRGTVELLHADGFRNQPPRSTYVLRSGARRLVLRFRGQPPPLQPGERLRVRGAPRGHVLSLRPAGIEALGRDPRRTLAATASGTRKVAVILFNFSDDRSQPFSAEQARQVMFTAAESVSAYYREQSFGRLSFTGRARSDGDVFGWYSIGLDSKGCRMQDWAQAARQAANAAGVSLSGYDHLVYAFPHTISCDWYGQAAISGSESWINGVFNRYVVGHELGHNLSLEHASTLICNAGGARVAISADCARDEYGDPFDIMGSGARHLSSWHKGSLGWLGAPNTQTVSVSGTYGVAPLEASSPAVQALRIPRGDTGAYYTLDYRQPYGSFFDNFGAGDPAVGGVMIRLCPDYGADARSLLIDATPETATFLDAALPTGRTFYDPTYRVLISAQAASPFAATVAVSFNADPPPPPPPPPDGTPPGGPTVLTARAAPGPSVKLVWSAASDNVGVAGYQVSRDGWEISRTKELVFTDEAVRAGRSATYVVRAYDAAGNLGPASPPAQVRLPVAHRPTQRAPSMKLRASSMAPRQARALAGRRFVAKLIVRRADTGGLLRRGQVACPAHVRGRAVAVVAKRLRRGRVVCIWRLPRSAHNMRLVAAIGVGYRGAFVRRRLVVRVR